MIHLQESSLKKKSLYYQRQLLKNGFRAIFIILVLMACFIIGQRVQWRSETQNFCNEPMDKVQEQKLKIDSEYQMADYLKPEFLPDQSIPDHIWDDLPTRGVYYMIVRNERLSEARAVIRSMEDNMKNGTSYPWVLLNNQHFSLNFRKYIKRVTRATIFFGKIDLDTWDYPYWIDVPRAEEMMMFEQEYSNVYNSARLSYHQLLRYQSGFFFHHPLFKNVEYTWRVEPGADYSCKMNQDLFMFMKEQKKKLGFVITMREAPQSIPTLWSRVNEFKEINPQYILDENSTIYPWIYNEREKDYNYCHFWSNFQLADLSFFRSEAYRTYFEYLDKTGNFFYERWSDAPVQTIAAALFLKKEEIHFFNEIGYTHSIATHCPYDENLLRDCSCDVTTNYDFHPDSCLKKLLKIIDPNLLDDMKSFANTKGISVPF